MKKALLLSIAVVFAVMGCHNLAGDISPTETYVNSYEIAGAIAPMAKIYLARLEENGTLTGDKLVAFKTNYKTGKGMMIQAGDVLDGYIDNPTGSLVANYPFLMQQFAVVLADLTGGMIVNSDGKKMGLDKPGPIRGMRVIVDPSLKALKAEANKIGPSEIIMTLNLLLVAVDKIMGMYTTSETLTTEQKTVYHSRVDFVKKAIPDWI